MLHKIAITIFCVMTLVIAEAYGEIVAAPQKVAIITRDAANYLTPENTFAARRSALLAGDLAWADETMTQESLAKEISKFAAAGIDRSRLFELERNVKDAYIVNKIAYQDAIFLIAEGIGYDGSVRQAPAPYVLENGLWKFTNKFAADEILFDYLHYVPPLFDGMGQSPDEVNLFLGYAQPTQAQTDLPAGTASYTIHIYYGKTVLPATFSAQLNKEDITSKFAPAAFTGEEVAIPLQPGRNVLVLSIEGQKASGKPATDTDRLVFVVP